MADYNGIFLYKFFLLEMLTHGLTSIDTQACNACFTIPFDLRHLTDAESFIHEEYLDIQC